MKQLVYFIFLFLPLPAFSQSAIAREIDQLMRAYQALDQFSGSLLVARGDSIILKKGYGLDNREWNVPATPGTRFRIASLTKQFTGMLIMQLKQAGLLELNAPVSTYLKWYPRSIGDRVTIHQLLTHTAGIPNFTGKKNFFAEVSPHAFSTRDFVEKYCTDSLEFEPGTRYSYSNTGYYLLGAIIESITGKPFATVLRQQILDVVHMPNSGAEDPAMIVSDMASGYEHPYGTWQKAAYINLRATIGAAGNMYATVEDLYRWDRALYKDQLLNAENRKLFFTPFLNGYAYGLGVVKIRIGNEKDSVLLMAHTGGINGFRAKILRIIDSREVIIACSNTSDDYGDADISAITYNILLLLRRQACAYPRKHIVTELGKNVLQGNAEKGIAFYKTAIRLPDYDTSDTENRVEALGRYLSDIGRRNDAIAILKFNTTRFPRSSKAYAAYADELEEDQQLQQALIQYQKALELEPANQQAAKALLRLKQQ